MPGPPRRGFLRRCGLVGSIAVSGCSLPANSNAPADSATQGSKTGETTTATATTTTAQTPSPTTAGDPVKAAFYIQNHTDDDAVIEIRIDERSGPIEVAGTYEVPGMVGLTFDTTFSSGEYDVRGRVVGDDWEQMLWGPKSCEDDSFNPDGNTDAGFKHSDGDTSGLVQNRCDWLRIGPIGRVDEFRPAADYRVDETTDS